MLYNERPRSQKGDEGYSTEHLGRNQEGPADEFQSPDKMIRRLRTAISDRTKWLILLQGLFVGG